MVLFFMVVMNTWIGVLTGVAVEFKLAVVGERVLMGNSVMLNTTLLEAETRPTVLDVMVRSEVSGAREEEFVEIVPALPDSVRLSIEIVEFVAEIPLILSDVIGTDVTIYVVVLSDTLIEAEGSGVDASLEGESVTEGVDVVMDDKVWASEMLMTLLDVVRFDENGASDLVRGSLLIGGSEIVGRGVAFVVALRAGLDTSLTDCTISVMVRVDMVMEEEFRNVEMSMNVLKAADGIGLVVGET